MPSDGPSVFISYSHDSREHKQWVAELARKLIENGIRVTLDQWDLRLGDDVPKFMEEGVRDSDRVLLICTEVYVEKANEGKGGVGYEAMVVTGELIQDLGTAKFIPVVRQNKTTPTLPTSVSTRLYIDLSSPDEEVLQQLLREIHDIPAEVKPPLGRSPFARTPLGREARPTETANPTPLPTPDDVTNPLETYHLALETARRGDLVAWRRLVRSARTPISESYSQWRQKYSANPPRMLDDCPPCALDGLSSLAPAFAVALAGIESGREGFSRHLGLLDDLLFPPKWELGGLTTIVRFPATVGFVFQALYGATCLHTQQLDGAIRLAQHPIRLPHETRTSRPLLLSREVTGWPETLGQKATEAWRFLRALPEHWDWLMEPFGDSDEYQSALSAYYLALHVMELAELIREGEEAVIGTRQLILAVPPCFLYDPDDQRDRAYRLLLSQTSTVQLLWEAFGTSKEDMAQHWEGWCDHGIAWVYEVSRGLDLLNVPHRQLFSDLGRLP